jgi:hypothetical protein
MPRYNHAFGFGFSLTTVRDGENVTGAELRAAILQRLADLGDDAQLLEACGAPMDTYEMPPVRTIRVTVREEVTERQTIEVDIDPDLDLDDVDAVHAVLEEAWTGGGYREVPNSKEVSVDERDWTEVEEITQ